MNKCMICNEELYDKISFLNIFKLNYSVHDKCIKNIIINSDRTIFPITNNIVYYDYLFFELDSKYNLEYLEYKYLNILFDKILLNSDWSMIIYLEDGLFEGFSYSDMQILFSLANSPILIVSFIYYDLSTVIYENI